MSAGSVSPVRRLLVLLVVVSALAACADDGDGDGDASANSTTTPTPTTAPTTSTASATSPPAPTTAPVTAAPTAPPTTTPRRLDFANPEVIGTGFSVPWGVAFLPDGAALVAERTTGRVLQFTPGRAPVEVMRLDSRANGEGGLLGLAVSPDYARDHRVFAYYTTASDNRVVRFTLGGRVEVILDGIAAAGVHNGGRIAFGPDGYLYVATGDAGQTSTSQNVRSLNGKILRITVDGEPAPGNPFDGNRVWTMGHRNVQGLAWDDRGRMFATEFGQNRLDEVNVIEPGSNYGWPLVEGAGSDPRFVNPLVTWFTNESSPSGAAIAGSALYVAALRGQRLWQVPLTADGLGAPNALFTQDYGRLRTVVTAPDGSLWFTTSNRDGRGNPARDDDRIIRVPLR